MVGERDLADRVFKYEPVVYARLGKVSTLAHGIIILSTTRASRSQAQWTI